MVWKRLGDLELMSRTFVKIQDDNITKSIFIEPPEEFHCADCGHFFVEGWGNAWCAWKKRPTKPFSPACEEFSRALSLTFTPEDPNKRRKK